MEMTERYYLNAEIEKAIRREEANVEREREQGRPESAARSAGRVAGLQEALGLIRGLR